MTYAWGLGTSTNNQAKAYVLLQGLISVNANKARNLILISDSSIIISITISKKTHFHSKLASLITRIQKENPRFQEVSFQILREHNWQVDVLANEATKLNVGVLWKMGVYLLKPSPNLICILLTMEAHHYFHNQHMSWYFHRHAISSEEMRCEWTCSPTPHMLDLISGRHFESFNVSY